MIEQLRFKGDAVPLNCTLSGETQMYLLFLDSGCKDKAFGPILKELMQTTNFRVTVVEESDVVEICGALKVDSNWFLLISCISKPRLNRRNFTQELLCFV